MDYRSLYRKHRPQNLNDLYGQNEIKQALSNAVIYDKFSHSFLFSGLRGTGKTSVARILSKLINCPNVVGNKSCNLCKICLSIEKGNNIDVIEIDGASNNGVEEIRELKNNVSTLPAINKYKIYIIDEVHMLTIPAFNALLKTIEEPPKHIIFILATTDPQKIPLTIISRCQKYNFRKLNKHELIGNLIKICDKEKINYDFESLSKISDISGGSARDSISLLEQSAIFCKNKISEHKINQLFLLASISDVNRLLIYIYNQDYKSVINKIEYWERNRINIKILISKIIEIHKEILEYSVTGDETFIKNLNLNIAREIFRKIETGIIIKIIDVFLSSEYSFGNSSNENIQLEYSLIKIIEILKKNKIKKLFGKELEENNLRTLINNNEQDQTKQDQTKQDQTKQDQTKQDQTKQDQTKQDQDGHNLFTFTNLNKAHKNKEKDFLLKIENENLEEKYNFFLKDKIDKSTNEDKDFSVKYGMCALLKPNKQSLRIINEDLNKLIKDESLLFFYNIKIRSVSDNIVLATVPTILEYSLINEELNKEIKRKKIEQILGKKIIFVVIHLDLWNALKAEYINLKKIDALPDFKKINYDTFYSKKINNKKQNVPEKNEKKFQKAKELFANLKIVD